MPNLPQAHAATTTTKLPSTATSQETAEILNLFSYYDEDSCKDVVCMLLRIEKDRLETLYNNQKQLPGGWQQLKECGNCIRMSILSSKSWHPKSQSRRVSGGYYLEIQHLVKWSQVHAGVTIEECIAVMKKYLISM